ncbi:hypothetical protein LPJ53_001488 [Coemansia erecta]|uniref:Uncharacterized protein n=1 Tax=Coemansia erecta TaxID=147472 RepID=A0A9W8CUH5_9FUNG|nr:hypothetical protein LPJ53_001488 [Coemansia erecta]
MSAFNSLPLDIIIEIIGETIRLPFVDPAAWTFAFSVAGVNRLWRRVALRRLFGSAFINNFVDIETHLFGFNQTNNWSTNVHCIQMLGHSALVRDIDIHVYNFFSLRSVFDQIFSILQGGQMDRWANLIRLTISISHYELEGNVVPLFIAPVGDNVDPNETCRWIGRFMPRITELVVDTRDTPADFLASCLVDLYGQQLRVIKSRSPLDLSNPHLSTQLRSLAVAIDYDNGMLFPLVTANTLESLCLYKAPPNFSWRQFWEEKSASKQIIFSNLRNLEIVFGTGSLSNNNSSSSNSHGSGNQNHFQLRFPSLKHMSTEFWYNSSDIICSESLPESLDYVRIWGFIKCVEHSFSVIPRHIGFLDIHMDEVEDTELDQFYALTNRILDASVAEYYSLTFHNSFFHFDLDRVGWFSLRKLVVLRVSMELAVSILEKLALLEAFHINYLVIDKEYTNEVWPESLGDRLPELSPFNSRVNYLGLICSKDFNHGLLIPQVFYYFMLRLHALERLYVNDDNDIFCRAFIGRYGGQYEHLNNIGVFKRR